MSVTTQRNGTRPAAPSPKRAGATEDELLDLRGQLEAIRRSQAVIEFKLDGTILTANENFLATMGYRLDEIQGQHHRMFAEPVYAASAEYRQFWADLNAGKF